MTPGDRRTGARGWEERNTQLLRRAGGMHAEIAESGHRDLAALSVASRQLRRMAG